MTKALVIGGGTIVALMASTGAIFPSHGARGNRPVRQIRDLSLEFVGQFRNSPPGVTPATHIHYGYLSHVRGLTVFKGAPASEATGLFTFFASAATLRVISDGPLRVITRAGKITIYRDPSPNGNFAKPESFRDGTRVLVARFRQEVVNDTVTGAFTTFHQNTIVSTRPFPSGRSTFRLGRVGETFRSFFSGHGNMPGPPSGFFGGYAVSR
jgi:hypothetical protein